MRALKKILFQAYGGFSDKRIKNLDKGDRFIADDRNDSDIGADGNLRSYFCMIFVEVRSNESVTLGLSGNIPNGKNVKHWFTLNKSKVETSINKSNLSININKGEQGFLNELAIAIDSIVAPGAPRYNVKSYKFVCPRTARSLCRLKKILDEAWKQPLPSEPKGFF
jgi:hypothetical protein